MRIFYSKLLLAVFIPALMISALHLHQPQAAETDVCVECAAHLPHVAHLSPSAGATLDCVFCQFLGLPYLLPILFAVVLLSRHGQKVAIRSICHPTRCAHLILSLRAPPMR